MYERKTFRHSHGIKRVKSKNERMYRYSAHSGDPGQPALFPQSSAQMFNGNEIQRFSDKIVASSETHKIYVQLKLWKKQQSDKFIFIVHGTDRNARTFILSLRTEKSLVERGFKNTK